MVSLAKSSGLNISPSRPPRLRRFRWLRDFLLVAQPPLLFKEGKTSLAASPPSKLDMAASAIWACQIKIGSTARKVSPASALLSCVGLGQVP